MTTELTRLKELKFPKYVKGMQWEDYYIKLLSAASTRGRASEAIKGEFMEHMPDTTVDDQGNMVMRDAQGNQVDRLSQAQTEMKAENQRAFAELVMAMPGGRLTKMASKATSTKFPEGCVFTAIKHLKAEISKVSLGNKAQLKKEFEMDEILPKKKNPAKYLDKLIDLRDELEDKYNYKKSDEDIVDQMLKVLGNEWDFTKKEIKKRRRNGEDIDLRELRNELLEEFEDLKLSRRYFSNKFIRTY